MKDAIQDAEVPKDQADVVNDGQSFLYVLHALNHLVTNKRLLVAWMLLCCPLAHL